jgi:DNA polymerase-3 subunit gamma/tau
MAHQVLARKYRPLRFADVVGQEHVTVTLMNALTQGRIAHGYIFSGHRGIGKTTIARILASALNCRRTIGSAERPTAEPCNVCDACLEIRAGNSVDVIEIDAATNRGIDEIRELRDAARYRPARDKYKIYILDEAHQITDAAFNALLKTLEEPPEHIVFMMATTQPEDIPQTVRSRCQHFSFHAVKLADILNEMRGIARHEGVHADETALALLGEAGDGSMRDALSIMDQAIASASVENGQPVLNAAQIRELMGTVSNVVFERILEAVAANDSAAVLTEAGTLLDAGNGPSQLARQAVRYLRSCVIAKIAGMNADGGAANAMAAELLQISDEERRRAARSAALFTEEELTRFLQVMLRSFDELGYRQEPRFHFELGLLKLVHLRRLLPIEEILSRIPQAERGDGDVRSVTPSSSAMTKPTAALVRSAAVGQSEAKASSVPPARQPVSPFQIDAERKRFGGDVARPNFNSNVESGLVSTMAAVATPAVETASISAYQQQTPHEQRQSQPPPIAAAQTITQAPQLAQGIAREIDLQPTPDAVAQDVESPSQQEATSLNLQAGSASARSSEDSQAAEFERIAVTALAMAKSQDSAADALGDSSWTVDGGTIRIQTQVSKTMLPIAVNPEAEKIVKDALRDAGHGALKLMFLSATAETKSAETAKKPKIARAGSAKARALAHPVVQRAQELFHAEVRNVIDLSDGK